MNRRSLYTCPALFLMLAAAAILRCSSGGSISGNVSETTNGVAAVIRYPDGSKAVDVPVYLRSADHVADPTLQKKSSGGTEDTVRTSNDGQFVFDQVDPGTYVIEAFDTLGNGLRMSEVTVPEESNPDSFYYYLGPQTLRPTGTISGTVKLASGGSFGNVYVLAFGVFRWCQPEADGSFHFDGLAAGRYDLRIISASNFYTYRQFDSTGVVVPAGDTAALDTITLVTGQIPVPQNLEVRYDTSFQRVYLSWSPVDTTTISGYKITREERGSLFSAAQNLYVAKNDTDYVDTAVVQGKTYAYHVTAVDAVTQNSGKWVSSRDDTVYIASLATYEKVFSTSSLSGGFSALSPVGDDLIAAVSSGTAPRVYLYTRNGLFIRDFWPDECTGEYTATNYLAADEEGRIFLEARDSGYVVLCDTTGVVISRIDLPSNTLPVTGMETADGRLYLCPLSADKPLSSYLLATSSTTTIARQTFGLDSLLALDFILSPASHTLTLHYKTLPSHPVVVQDTTGTVLRTLDGMGASLVGVRHDGDFLVVDNQLKKVAIHAATGEYQGKFYLYGLNDPVSAICAPEGGTLFIATGGLFGRVFRFRFSDS